MWQAKHEPWCDDQSRFSIVRERVCSEDVEGNVLESDPSQGEVVHADCSNCYAPADWIEA